MDFLPNQFEKKSFVIEIFFNCLKNLLFGSYGIHHSHVRSETVGYMHNFCNIKIRENQNKIPVFANNLPKFGFFFVFKGIKLCVLRTKQVNFGGINLTNVQYASIGLQVKFIYTIKYYQQLCSSLAKSADETKKIRTRNSCLKFIEKTLTYSSAFANLSDENKEWILDYLAGGKGVIPHEKIA